MSYRSNWKNLTSSFPVAPSPLFPLDVDNAPYYSRSISREEIDQAFDQQFDQQFDDSDYLMRDASSFYRPSISRSSASRSSITNNYPSLSKKKISFAKPLEEHDEPNQFNIHLSIVFAEDEGREPYQLVWEPEATHWGAIRTNKPCSYKPICQVIKQECQADSYLDFLCQEKVANFLYQHKCTCLLVVHNGHIWLLKGEGLLPLEMKDKKKGPKETKEQMAQFSFSAEHFFQQDQLQQSATLVPNGIYPVFKKMPCKEEFCIASVEAAALFIDAEMNETWHLKKKTVEVVEKKYLELQKLLQEVESSSCDSSCSNACEKAAEFYQQMKKLHLQLETHNKLMSYFLNHCGCGK